MEKATDLKQQETHRGKNKTYFLVCGEFGSSNPAVLQRTMGWVIALHFGFRSQDGSRRLKWRDAAVKKDTEAGNKIRVWKFERVSKTW